MNCPRAIWSHKIWRSFSVDNDISQRSMTLLLSLMKANLDPMSLHICKYLSSKHGLASRQENGPSKLLGKFKEAPYLGPIYAPLATCHERFSRGRPQTSQRHHAFIFLVDFGQL